MRSSLVRRAGGVSGNALSGRRREHAGGRVAARRRPDHGRGELDRARRRHRHEGESGDVEDVARPLRRQRHRGERRGGVLGGRCLLRRDRRGLRGGGGFGRRAAREAARGFGRREGENAARAGVVAARGGHVGGGLLGGAPAPAAAAAVEILVLVAAAEQRRPQAAPSAGILGAGVGHAGDGAALGEDLGFRLLVAGERLVVGRQVHRLAVREQRHELPAGHARPGAHAAGVEMHEGMGRVRIEADAAVLEAHADRAHPGHVDVRQVEIERLAGHVLAELGDGARAPPQHGVGLRRPIGRDDVDRLARPDRAVDLPDDIEEARLHPGRLVGAPVAQQPVQLLERALVVIAVALEGDRGVFLGVRMEDRDGAGIAVGDRVLGRAGAAQEGRDGNRAEDRAAWRGGTAHAAGRGRETTRSQASQEQLAPLGRDVARLVW